MRVTSRSPTPGKMPNARLAIARLANELGWMLTTILIVVLVMIISGMHFGSILSQMMRPF